MPVKLAQEHPDWRVYNDPSGQNVQAAPPIEENLGTRIGCNAGPWSDYFIELLVELAEDYGLDGYSFDGNYHPPICYCPNCQKIYPAETGRPLPEAINLDSVNYRRYLVWRGEKLEDYYRRTQEKLKAQNPNAVVMSWSANAGRYGHLLTSPRAMSTRMNLLLDLPMQEWWLDETNFGASVAPAFGAAYIRATVGGRPAASEPYLMSHGNPYGTDSFPKHERITRGLLAMTNGSLWPEAFGWPGHADATQATFREIEKRERWLTRTQPAAWGAILVSEQTRQFYAYRDIAERFLPHVFGTFRVGMEEHLPLTLINDWDLNPQTLAKYRVLVLPNATALSDVQVAAVREYIASGGGLVATGETSLCDELGQPRADFALQDLFGVSYRGRPATVTSRPELDANFAITVDENYWKQRSGLAMVHWSEGMLLENSKLLDLVPLRNVRFRGPMVAVSEPVNASEVLLRMRPDGDKPVELPAGIARVCGAGRVVYLPAAIDAALWSYSYPYQRVLLANALRWAAQEPPAIAVESPMCVQTTFMEQSNQTGSRTIVHLFNSTNTTAHRGLPNVEVPLREEAVPIHGIRLRFTGDAWKSFHVEPGNVAVQSIRDGDETLVSLPPLEIHYMLVGERK